MDYQIIISGDIGWSVTAQDIAYQLSQYKDKHVDCKISSLGGSTADALDIYRQFLDHGDVTVYLSGFVASAATIIAMGAKEVKMYDTSLMLIHKCMNLVDAFDYMNEDDINALIADLEKVRDNQNAVNTIVANIYVKKSGKSVDDIKALLTEQKWLLPQEALDWHLVDAVIESEEGTSKHAPVNFVNYLKSQDLPIPEGYFSTLSPSPQEKKTGLLEKCASAIREMFSAHEETKEPTIVMLTDKTNLNALLHVEGVEDKEGSVTLTVEQVTAIESHMQQQSDDLASAQHQVEELQSQLDALKQAPGDKTEEVDDTIEEEVSANEMFNLIKNAL